MKFTSVLAFFLATLTASATPLYKRQNVTSGGGTVPVIITGGPAVSGSQSNVTTTTLFNSTSTLNITQLYQIATQVNQTLQSESSSGIIIVTNWRSIETLSFFCSIVFNTSKTIVITENFLWGVPILSSSDAEGRGTLVAGRDKVVYSGVFPPYTVPVGVLSGQKNVQWFFDACEPTLIASNSTIRTQYSNFTSAQISSNASSGTNTSLIILHIQGLVVVSSGTSHNSTVASWTSVDFPVVYASDGSSGHDGSGIGFISNTSIPQGAISAGYLSPIQAQTLLSIAIHNQVTSSSELQQIFPC
ncbi:CBM_collapsed_G0026590.mRNA.1.CDS.1 [Saccharomyces cerevisiae]|nr:CBM_collapsed_G0026590.mRNA.1.CDS.1 [Saccharomyces cerevisiae]